VSGVSTVALADLKDELGRARVSLWLLAALAVIGAAVVLAVLAARHERLEAVERCHVQLEAIAETRSAAIELWVAERFGDARVIAADPAVAALAALSTAPPGQSTGDISRTRLGGTLTSVARNYEYLSAVVLAPDGRILLGGGENFELDRACLDLVHRCQVTRRPVADFHLHDGATVVVQFAAPVSTVQAGAPVAVVLLTSDPENWLYPFLRHQPIPSDSGETVLVRKDGDDALYLSPLRHHLDAPLTLRRPLSTPGFAAAAALQGRRVFSEYTDYAGKRVFAVTRSLEGTPWAMMVKVDRAEMLRDYQRGLAGPVMILTGFVLALAGVAYGAWHRQRHLARLALARSEARVASLLDQGSDAVLFIARNGVIAEANARACEMFGHSHSEMVGMNVAELETLGPGEGAADRLADITGRQTAVFDTLHVRKDGTEFSGEVSARVVEEAGQTWTVAVIRNVSERRRAEGALRQSEQRFRTLFEGMGEGVAIHELCVDERNEPVDYRIVSVNPAFERHTGLSRSQIEGRLGSEAYGVEPAPFLEVYSRVALSGQHEFFDTFFAPLSRHFTISVSSPRRGAFVTVFADITERKKGEESLRKVGERLELALEGAGLGSYDSDIVAGRSAADGRYFATLGYEPGEIDLTLERFEKLIHPDDLPTAKAAYEAHLAGKVPMFMAEYRMRHKGGHWVWVQDKGKVAARDPNGRPLRLLGVHLDITERKRAEIEREELAANVRALSAYLSKIGEELRTRIARELHDRIGQNLAAIALDLDIVRSRLPAEAMSAAESRLDDAGRIVEQMVHDVRDLMAELRPPLLDEIGLLAALRWYGQQFALRSGVAFQIKGGNSLPRLAPGTETAVFRIAQEALTNVAMHARAQRVSARFSVGKDAVVLVIEDDGGGFDMDALGASGISASWGLLSMRERAQAVGGTTRVESSLGAGTRVTIEVPR